MPNREIMPGKSVANVKMVKICIQPPTLSEPTVCFIVPAKSILSARIGGPMQVPGGETGNIVSLEEMPEGTPGDADISE
jgi:hypothetical protein